MGRFQILEILSSVKLQAFLCKKAFSGDQQPGRVTEAAVQIQGLSSLNFPNRIHQEALVGSLGSKDTMQGPSIGQTEASPQRTALTPSAHQLRAWPAGNTRLTQA